MWPFRRKPEQPDIDLRLNELRGSQLENTMRYGWNNERSAEDTDVLRESLERHEDGLPKGSESPVTEPAAD